MTPLHPNAVIYAAAVDVVTKQRDLPLLGCGIDLEDATVRATLFRYIQHLSQRNYSVREKL